MCEKEEVSPQEKRIEMLESYDTYTYMKKRWEKYVRKQGIENVSGKQTPDCFVFETCLECNVQR